VTDGACIGWQQDDDGVVVLTLDAPSADANRFNAEFTHALEQALERIASAQGELSGIVLTSAKRSFCLDSDPSGVLTAERAQAGELSAVLARDAALLRRIETCGRPVVAAIAGDAVGDGLALALAAHRRIAVDEPTLQLGLPQVKLGLLPGRGGLTRAVRLLGISDALTEVLLEGKLLSAQRAAKLGLIDELVGSPGALLVAAKAWIAAGGDPRQPWDRDDYRMPGGTPSSPGLAQFLPAYPANLRKQLRGANFPAPLQIMAAAVEGAQLDLAGAVTVETRYLVDLMCGQVAKNMVQAFHVDLPQAAGRGRAGDAAPFRPRRVAVLGAGMMGSAIAYLAAAAGLDVVLRDVSLEAAERGRSYAEAVVRRGAERGRIATTEGEQLLARIKPTDSLSEANGVDLVIEAVFEDATLKAGVLHDIDARAAPDSLIASNTSTLPITGLAESVSRPADFVGLHFFSPAERMPLLEIIAGAQTSAATVARALDVAVLLGKTPIVVNDSRGFFTSRVISTFIDEALAMLLEGIPPASVEQASLQAGYPAAVLQLTDELSIELMRKIRNQYKAAAAAEGVPWESVPAERLVDEMLDTHGRRGRAAGAGFYDYVDGKRTGLWPGLSGLAPAPPALPPLRELEERMLFIEAIESARCRDEGVIESVADANVGSILGIGYPAWTGGVLQYINGYPGGPTGFVRRARELSHRHGKRFEPPDSLVDLAARRGRYSD
jgi:3-hydroxyacyl-CoA dehydrogenase/enoyl-CoA hydratase/3-hydroxybutyryl-CoA epimerase